VHTVKIHLASQHDKENLRRRGVFDARVTACAVFSAPRRVTYEKRLVTCTNCNHTSKPKGRRPGFKVTRSTVRDEPGHPVAAPCTISHCQYFAMRAAVEAIYTAVRDDEKGEYWTLRKYLDDHGIFNGDLARSERLIAAACRHVLGY